MTKRELAIYPAFPVEIIENDEVRFVVTELAFGESEIRARGLPSNIDTVFCFASNEGHQRQAKSLTGLFTGKAGQQVGQILFTGGADWKIYPDDVPDLGQSIAVATWRAIDTKLPTETMVGIETVSTNTKENAAMGWAALAQPPGESIAISCLTFHAGRCHRTLMTEAARHSWKGDILYYPYQALEKNGEGQDIDLRADGWWESPVTAGRVWGEVERIQKYGSRGDIAFLPADADRFNLLKKTGLLLSV